MGVTAKKEAIVAGLKENLTASKGVVFTTYKGLTVAQDTALRRELRAAGVNYHVVKNTMTGIAAKAVGMEELIPHFNGTTAMAYSTEDAVAPAKVICDFIKKNKLDKEEILVVKAGVVEGKIIDANGVKALANLPSKEELIAKLLGSMQAPISNTVGVLSGIMRQAVYVLNAVREKKEQESA